MTTKDKRALVDAVDALLDLATSRHRDPRTGDTVTECHMCEEWDDHAAHCPVPALTRWMQRGPR